jgi:hypothetical protein
VVEQRARLLAWPLAYISAAFSSTEHRPGFACGDLDGRLRGRRPVERGLRR